jgi:hypothetical protein
VTFWIDLLLSFPRSLMRTVAEFRNRKLVWMTPLVIFLLLIAVLLLVVGSVSRSRHSSIR